MTSSCQQSSVVLEDRSERTVDFLIISKIQIIVRTHIIIIFILLDISVLFANLTLCSVQVGVSRDVEAERDYSGLPPSARGRSLKTSRAPSKS